MKARYVIPALVAGAAIGAAGTAGAASQWNHHQGGIWCKTINTEAGLAALCIPETGKGYGVGINKSFVTVVSLSSGKTVFMRLQP